MESGKPKSAPIRLMASGDPESLEQARRRLFDEVMAEQEVVSRAWSQIDGPFSHPDSVADYESARAKFLSLVDGIIHMPDSIEGLRYLEQWLAFRMKQISEMKAGAVVGQRLTWRIQGIDGIESLLLSEDSAKAIQVVLAIVEGLFEKFPLSVVPNQVTDKDVKAKATH
jgi:hypothetical protein